MKKSIFALFVSLAMFSTLTVSAEGTSEQVTHEMVCRGGGSLYFDYTPFSNFSNQPQIWIRFNRSTTGVGSNWENVNSLSPGQCAWLDRGVSAGEPEQLLVLSPLIKPNSFSISWTGGKVMGISSELTYINALQSADTFQSFFVYNDRKGNFIATKVGRSQ